MKLQIKKQLSLILASLILVTTFTACTSDEGTTSSTASTASTGSSSTADQVEEMEPMTYEIFLSQSVTEYPADGGVGKDEILRRWEEDLGITNTDFNLMLVGGSDYTTKLNSLLAAGQAPDYFSTTVDTLATLAENGVIAPVDEYVDTIMPNVQALLEIERNQVGFDGLSYGGEHYGFPTLYMEGPLSGVNVSSLVIRTDWLENLDMEVPVTLDELHDVLYAFTYNDPDGNGLDDTYGLGGNKTHRFAAIFGAYGVYMKDINSWQEVDGQLVHSTTVEGSREALETLASWYEEGLIDPDKFIIEAAQAGEKFASSKFGVYEQSTWGAESSRGIWEDAGEDFSCTLIAPPVGPDGDKGNPVNYIQTGARVISQNAVDEKDIERLMTILDWTTNDGEDGGMRLVTYGEADIHHIYHEESDYIEQVFSTGELFPVGYGSPVRWISVGDRRWIPEEDMRRDELLLANEEENLIVAEFGSPTEAMANYPELFSVLWAEYFTKIITGVMPVEAFDEYVDEFYSSGGTELTEETNAIWSASN